MRKAVIIYLSLLAIGLLIFLPVRDALYMSYNMYRDFGFFVALGYTLIGTDIVYISQRKEEKTDRRRFTIIAFLCLLILTILLFCGIQWLYDR